MGIVSDHDTTGTCFECGAEVRVVIQFTDDDRVNAVTIYPHACPKKKLVRCIRSRGDCPGPTLGEHGEFKCLHYNPHVAEASCSKRHGMLGFRCPIDGLVAHCQRVNAAGRFVYRKKPVPRRRKK